MAPRSGPCDESRAEIERGIPESNVPTRAPNSPSPALMHTLDALLTIAEISIAVIGFAGIIFALRPPSTRQADTMHRLRLRIMIEASAYMMLFALLPALLLPKELDSNESWHLGSALLAITGPILISSIYIRQRRLFGSTLLRETVLFDSFAITLALLVEAILIGAWLGVLPGRASASYLLGLLFHQGAAIAMFLRALFAASQGAEPSR